MNIFFKMLVLLLLGNASLQTCAADYYNVVAKKATAGINLTVTADDRWIDILNDQLAEFNYESLLKESDSNPLFKQYPGLKAKVPYIAFGALPTPLEKLNGLSKAYNCQMYAKQDSLSGGFNAEGVPFYGGNKVRKLEFLLARAKKLGVKKVVTFGCVGSNHAVATTVHARRLGMEPICVLKHQEPSPVVQHNLLMQLNHHAELHYTPNNDVRKADTFKIWRDHFNKDKQAPYIIPTGGSNKYGTVGFVNAVFELVEQIKLGLMPQPTHIYVPCGSCATTAGILLGCKAAGLQAKVVAVTVEPEEDPTFAQQIDTLFKETNEYLHACDQLFPILSYTDADLEIEKGFAGDDYGLFTEAGVKAAEEMHKLDKITLEGTYTAKALAGLLSQVTKNKDPKAVILFWNTYSGLDFSKTLTNRVYTQMPACFHAYFNEDNIQPINRN